MAGSVWSRRDSSLSLNVLNCKFWRKVSAQQAVHQALQKDAILWTEPGELDPHALAGFDVSNDSLGLNFSAGNFEGQLEFCTHGRGSRRANENSSHAESPHAGNLVLRGAVPGHPHSFGQGDAGKAACSGGSLFSFL